MRRIREIICFSIMEWDSKIIFAGYCLIYKIKEKKERVTAFII
jgi:hypothetical protein